MKRLVNMVKELPEELHVSKVDFLLTLAISVMAGTIVGMLISPRRNQRFGVCGDQVYNYDGAHEGEDDSDDE